MSFKDFEDEFVAKFGRRPVVFTAGAASELRVKFFFDNNHVRHVSADWKGFTLISRYGVINTGFWVARDDPDQNQPFRVDDPAGIVDVLENAPSVGSAAVLLERVARVLEREGYIKTP